MLSPGLRIPDPSIEQIAQNNRMVSSTQPLNPYLAHRHFHATPPLTASAQAFEVQSRVLRSNSYVLDLSCFKYEGVASSTSNYLGRQPCPTLSSSVNTLSVINAAAHAKQQTGKLALKEILPVLKKRPNDVGLLLTVIQLHMLSGNHGSAIALFQAFLKRLEESKTAADQDVRYAPGLIATLVSLCTIQGRKAQVRSELAKAASYWRRKPRAPSSLLLAAGTALVQSTKAEDLIAASDIFDNLRKQDPTSRLATAGYIASNAVKSPNEVASDVDKLTPVARLTMGIDVAALLDAGIPAAPSTLLAGTKRKRGGDEAAKPGKKRVRRSRLPKNHDATKTADPERWLPLRDRSTYRPKGKRGKQKAAALTQGGLGPAGVEERSAVASGAGAGKVEKVPSGANKAKKKKAKAGKR